MSGGTRAGAGRKTTKIGLADLEKLCVLHVRLSDNPPLLPHGGVQALGGETDAAKTERISKMINRNLYKRLERLEARVQDAIPPRHEVVNSQTPGGPTCVRGPDGRQVWWNPPEGCKSGEPLDGVSSEGMHIVVMGVRGGRDAAPTTAIGPDGQVVWLDPPEGCQAGEPIEHTAREKSASKIVRASFRD
jgi:hypothetical protein